MDRTVRARLIELAQGLELDVNKRSSKDELIDVLVGSERGGYELYEEKCEQIYEHCHESYYGDGASKYRAQPGAVDA